MIITVIRKLVPQRGCPGDELLRVFDRDRLAGFEVEDGAMLSAVILEHAVDVFES